MDNNYYKYSAELEAPEETNNEHIISVTYTVTATISINENDIFNEQKVLEKIKNLDQYEQLDDITSIEVEDYEVLD